MKLHLAAGLAALVLLGACGEAPSPMGDMAYEEMDRAAMPAPAPAPVTAAPKMQDQTEPSGGAGGEPAPEAAEQFIAYSHSLGLRLPVDACLLYTSPSPRDLSTSRMPSSA